MRSTINFSLNLYQPQAISCLYHVACYIYTDMYIPVPVPQPGQPQMPAQYAGQPFMQPPYMGPTPNQGLLPMPAPYPPPLMSQPTVPPNVRKTQRNTSQGWLSSTLSSEIDNTYNMGM
jgi:hypothetical protein